MNINLIAQHLNALGENATTGLSFDALPLEGTVDVLQVVVEDREEIPVFVTVTDDQILCTAYLWGKDEVNDGMHAEMHEAMLSMNIPMPLSSFAKIEDKYSIFGAMSTSSSIDDIELEIATLSNNSLDIITEMSDFLK